MSSRKNPYSNNNKKLLKNPYGQGGSVYDFLFDDEDDEEVTKPEVTAPAEEDLPEQEEQQQEGREEEDYDKYAFMEMFMRERRRNPYLNGSPKFQSQGQETPYTGKILSSGEFGDKNIGPYGKQIYGKLAEDLGYAPVANSIYRSKAQNDALIAAGKPASRNSYHLTGNAVDIKPADWNALSSKQQQYYRSNYDVIYHDNHYHVEPR